VILLVTDTSGALRALDFEDGDARLRRLLKSHYGETDLGSGVCPRSIDRALTRYFDGFEDALSAVPVETGGTAFQRKVWAELRTIPFGATMSYGGVAGRIGLPKASRAVGAANGANPIALVVPCHRVIGADASLTGFAGGLRRKDWLLRHEGSFRRGGLFNVSPAPRQAGPP
jgi:methylated-DNA-[protein]-cysteine S-methyltransferase